VLVCEIWYYLTVVTLFSRGGCTVPSSRSYTGRGICDLWHAIPQDSDSVANCRLESNLKFSSELIWARGAGARISAAFSALGEV